jgi:hypothetical protein
MEDNMVELIIGFVDKRFQGQKTYILMGVGIGGAATWKMGMDRPKQ